MSLISIKGIRLSKPIIRMHQQTADAVNITPSKAIRIKYGMRQIQAQVRITSHLKKQHIEMDQSLIGSLKIDESLRYVISSQYNKLVIGPVIGIVFEYNDNTLIKKLSENKERYVPYVSMNKELGGLSYFFALDQIDYTKKEIKGYVYDAKTSSWSRRVLPFPGVIFHRTTVSERLKQIMNGKIINANRFNKADFWNMMKDHPQIRDYLPETSTQINKENLDHLLKKFKGVFLKHTNESLGRGIYLIIKDGRNYKVRKNLTRSAIVLTERTIEQFLAQNRKEHILQQAISLKMHKNRKIDYRVIVVKDLHDTWRCRGIIGWLGDTHGLTINTLSEVHGKQVEAMLKLQFNYNKADIKIKKNELSQLGIALARELDKRTGPYVDLGIDIGLDSKGKLWVFEVNVCQDLRCPLWINDKDMYKANIYAIIRYAKKVAMSELNAKKAALSHS
jgi:hypothetical protein